MSCVRTKLDHDLVEIQRAYTGDDVYAVVRWCRQCGGVVIDEDFDGRTAAGAGMSMLFPKLAYDKAKEIK